MVQKKKVLIVDDKVVNRYILKSIFEDEYDVIECAGGEEAMTALQQEEKPSVVLLDIVMPEYDGFSVLKYMEESHLQSIPVVLISADVNDENIHRAFLYQVADYIQKPFQDTIVKRRVEKIIDLFEKKAKAVRKSEAEVLTM